jgi:tol-pal system protein YbgF
MEMKKWFCEGYLVLALLVLVAAGCESTYAYLPGKGSTAAQPAGTAAPAETAPPAAAAAPAPAAPPSLEQRVADLEMQVHHLEARLAEKESHKAAPTAKEKKVVAAPSVAVYPKAPAAAGEDKSYTEAMRLYHAKKYSQARTRFNQFLKSNPSGAKAQEARYYLADSYYLENKYKEAGLEFNKLTTQYPKSVLAPAAMLRQAICYKNLNQAANYRSTMQKLVKTYPNSPEAKEALKWQKQEKKAPEKKAPEKKGEKKTASSHSRTSG